MKRIVLMVIAAALISSVAFAQSNQVLSRNAVGYVKVVAPRGNFSLARQDFNPLSGNATVSNMFGQSTFPTGTIIYIWDNIGSKYTLEVFASNKTFGLTWSPNTNLLDTGMGFWVRIPAVAPSNDYTAFMMGEVPDRFTQPTATVSVLAGFNLIGYPYPADALWTNTMLAKQAVTGDVLYTWNGAGYALNVFASNKVSAANVWSVPTQVLYVGQGYWYKRRTGASTVTWNEPKPYTWP